MGEIERRSGRETERGLAGLGQWLKLGDWGQRGVAEAEKAGWAGYGAHAWNERMTARMWRAMMKARRRFGQSGVLSAPWTPSWLQVRVFSAGGAGDAGGTSDDS
jgi:hypothetical protein